MKSKKKPGRRSHRWAFPLGVLLGIIYWRTKNIRYTILLHVAVNTLGGLLPVLLEQIPSASGPWQSVPTMLSMLFASAVFGLAVVGVIFLIRFRRRFLPVESPLPRCRKPFYLNVGWFIACTVFAAMFVYIEFFA